MQLSRLVRSLPDGPHLVLRRHLDDRGQHTLKLHSDLSAIVYCESASSVGIFRVLHHTFTISRSSAQWSDTLRAPATRALLASDVSVDQHLQPLLEAACTPSEKMLEVADALVQHIGAPSILGSSYRRSLFHHILPPKQKSYTPSALPQAQFDARSVSRFNEGKKPQSVVQKRGASGGAYKPRPRTPAVIYAHEQCTSLLDALNMKAGPGKYCWLWNIGGCARTEIDCRFEHLCLACRSKAHTLKQHPKR